MFTANSEDCQHLTFAKFLLRAQFSLRHFCKVGNLYQAHRIQYLNGS